MSEELGSLIALVGLRPDSVVKLLSGGSGLRHDFPINPENFLEQAEADYEFGGNAALLNSITNAKRAINCQVDRILSCFGYDVRRLSFPQRLDRIAAMGFVAPRILRRVNDARNLLEHEYKAPTETEVADALDLAALFVEAGNRRIDLFEHEFALANKEDVLNSFDAKQQLSVSYRDRPYADEKPHVFCVAAVRVLKTAEEEGRFGRRELLGEVFVGNSSACFAPLIRLVVAGDNESKTRQAVQLLFDRASAAHGA